MISNNMNFHPSNSHRLKNSELMTMVGHVLWCTTICILTISITKRFINYDHICKCRWLKDFICIIWSNWCYKTCLYAFASPTSSFFISSLSLKRLFVGHYSPMPMHTTMIATCTFFQCIICSVCSCCCLELSGGLVELPKPKYDPCWETLTNCPLH
jgi:hypothetical protein